MGGMRAHRPLCDMLTHLGVTTLPGGVAVGGAFKAFNEDNDLIDERQRDMLDGAVTSLVHMSRSQANSEAVCSIVKSSGVVGVYGSINVPMSQ